MTPTSSEKQAALAWFDRPVSYVGHSKDAEHGRVLAAALRQAEAEAESWNRQTRVEFELRKKTESRIKTLEEENARMRGVVKAAKKYEAGMPHNACGCYIQERFDLFAALKQEAE